MSEIWTATGEEGDEIVFNVKDESTGKVREERMQEPELLLMLHLGGYHPFMATALLYQDFPWRFRCVGNGVIYIDGSSVGLDSHHSID